MERIFIEVAGGVVQSVCDKNQVELANEAYTVLDWDNIKADPVSEWQRLDKIDREYLQTHYPDVYQTIADQVAADAGKYGSNGF